MKNGTYKYLLNSEPAGITETFNIKTMPDSSVFTTSTRNAADYGTTIRVWTIELNGLYKTCNIEFRKDHNLVEAAYEFIPGGFRISRKLNGNTIQNETFNSPDNAFFFPLMRCYQGQLIRQIESAGRFVVVIVPDIQNPGEVENLFKPTFDERTAEFVSEQNGIHVYKYMSTNYGEDSEFHIDKSAMLVYYKFVQSEKQTWEVRFEADS